MFYFRLLPVMTIVFSFIAQHTSLEDINFLVLGPYPDNRLASKPGWNAGPALIAAARLAAYQINARADVLPGFKLKLVGGDSGCDVSTKAAISFVKPLFPGHRELVNKIYGVIGPGCSDATHFIGTLVGKEGINLIQIAPTATSPDLTDTKKYNNTFRMLSSTIEFVHTFQKLIKISNWENVAVLYEGHRLSFQATFSNFSESLGTRIGFSSIVSELNIPLNSIKAKHRIIFVIAGITLSQRIMCLAYHSQPPMLYPVYQWLFLEKSLDNFLSQSSFSYKGVDYNCSKEQMQKVMQEAILNRYRLHREDTASKTEVGLTYNEYLEQYSEYLEVHEKELPEAKRQYERNGKEYGPTYYDATWAMALTLNKTMSQLGFAAVANYSFGQHHVTSVIKTNLKTLEFEGLLGKVAFNSNTHDLATAIDIYQVKDNRSYFIGYYQDNIVNLTSNASFISSTFTELIVSVHPAVSYTFFVLSIIVLVYTAGLHFIFILYKDVKCIKASGQILPHLIFSGCYLLILVTFVSTMAYSNFTGDNLASHVQVIFFGVTCNLVYWKLTLGLSLILGSLCAQSWRLYWLFNNTLQIHVLLSDFYLTLFASFIVCLNAVILTTWMIIDPLLVTFKIQQTIARTSISVVMIRRFCTCQKYSMWLGLTFGINVLLSAILVVLSTLNRRINRKYFKRTKSINVMVYIIEMVLVLCIGMSVILHDNNIYFTYVLREVCFLAVVIIVCSFIFLPQALPVLLQIFKRSKIKYIACLSSF